MHKVNSLFTSRLKRAYSVTSKPKITFEWNYNRFGDPDHLSNGGFVPEDEDEVFPLESILAPNRPKRSSISKGWTMPGKLGREAAARTNDVRPQEKHTYVASPDSKYKYWISPTVSSTVRNADYTYTITNCWPMVVFRYGYNTNKLVAQFETTGSSRPVDLQVQITADGTTWVNAGTVQTPNDEGRLELYLQDNGTWTQTENLNNYMYLKGMRVRVTKMNRPGNHCHVIEMAMMKKMDLTDRVVDYDFNYNVSEPSFVAPLGKAESASGGITLSNADGFLDAEIYGQEMYGMAKTEAEVRVTLETTAGGVTVKTPQGVMFVESWGEDSGVERKIQLEDASMFLKRINPPPMLLDTIDGTEAIWRLLESVGFVDYFVDEASPWDLKMRYYWTDPDKSVWAHIQEISEGLQIACFFDEEGRLRIRSRERTYEKDPSQIAWTFDGQKVTSAMATAHGRPNDVDKLADLKSMSRPINLHANKVAVEYQTTKISSLNKEQPKMEVVWEPEGTVALRSGTLIGSMTATQTYGSFGDSNFSTWPFEGYVQVDGEIMKWTKKRYKYLDATSTWKYAWLSDSSERAQYDALNTTKNHMNKYDGGLYFGDQRGVMSTYARPHTPRAHKFNRIRTVHPSGAFTNSSKYTKLNYKASMFQIRTSSEFTAGSFTVARAGASTYSPPRYLGTSLRFPKTKSYKDGLAGIWFGGESSDMGYYLEVRPTSSVKNRKLRNEVSLYWRGSNGKMTMVSKGKPVAISKGQWYDIDIHQIKQGGDVREVTVMIDGVTVLREQPVPPRTRPNGELGGFYGIFARGRTHVDFEYFYAATSDEEVPMSDDDASRFDLITGGYKSNYYNKYLYRARYPERMTRRTVGKRSMNQGFLFDDFGTEAHELRMFDVQFDPNPVVHSRLYLSNEWYADCLEYFSDHKSARFLVAGKGRRNVILNGEDVTIYDAENPVDQKMFIYGRVVTQDSAEKIEVENVRSIRRVGEVALTISSPWIQSDLAAKKIANWVSEHWSYGSEYVEVETFGNPLLQISDIVRIHYEEKGIYPDRHQYYVVGVSYVYDRGLKTTYRLQRKTGLMT